MFYLTTHSTHFIYGYMASDIWLRTNLIVRKETRCHHIGYSFRLPARVLLYAPSHRQDSTYHSLCYTSHVALAGTRNTSMGPPWRVDPSHHEQTLLPWSYISLHSQVWETLAFGHWAILFWKLSLKWRHYIRGEINLTLALREWIFPFPEPRGMFPGSSYRLSTFRKKLDRGSS